MQIRSMLKFHPVPIQIAKTKLRKRKRNDFEQFSGFEQKGTCTQCWWERKIVPASVEIGVDVHQNKMFKQQNKLYLMILLWICENYFHT